MPATQRGVRNGTVVAVVSFAALCGFFVYQWWFNPTRAVQRRLNDIAAALSIPESEAPLARVTRTAQLRKYLADDIRVRAGASELRSRDQIIGVVSAVAAPPGGLDVQFVDVQIRVDHNTAVDADAYLTVEMNGRDASTGQPTRDTRDAAVRMKKLNGEWVVAAAETQETLAR